MTTFSPFKILPLLVPAAFLTTIAVLWLLAHPELLNNGYTDSFKTAFLGILLEALPFVLLGALLSSLLRVFVPDEMITRWIPRRPVPAILLGCLLGILFPVCECGMIPLVRRLMHKGMPLHVAVVFILSGPVLNPVVYGATLTAFRSHPSLAYARMGLAFAVAALIGLLVYATVRKSPLRHSIRRAGGAEHHSSTRGGRLTAVFVHTSDEFFEMGKYLIIGCLLTAGIQTFMHQGSLSAIGAQPLGSYLFMMGLAFALSLCSTSDAFVASTFLHTFPSGSLLAFMVLGPMLDFKNSLMLLSLFKTKFALYLFFLIFSAVFTLSVLSSFWL
ncbi:permease [Paenibacillus sp. MMS20-IR301]|uniref:permease n=1 Tax=Paenibacillus sp. MMS20-IR301 TaxID=2895946 RepID=UPI0028E4C34C|nr:permease [Paenibacillus sp. MMS20-IR301]WNS46214.1 permease [Paenibacillus sp. MMS20-IR301]